MTSAAELSAAAIVVGGGISGMAAAAALVEDRPDRRVQVIDRGLRLGGRMAARTLRSGPWAGHVVDLGAAYFTASDPAFRAVVDRWDALGLARPWTDTFAVADPDGITDTRAGPLRWTAAAGGLRGLVEDLSRQLPASVTIHHPIAVTEVHREAAGWRLADSGGRVRWRAAAVGLCMPPTQAVRLLTDPPSNAAVDAAGSSLLARALHYRYQPILTVVAQWSRREWDNFDACFVNGDPVVGFVADDGARRGDRAAILVAQSTPAFAARFVDAPQAAAPELVAGLRRILKVPAPIDVEVKRWRQARPVVRPSSDCCLVDATASLGIASDAFDDRPRIEAAWLSGRELGTILGADARNP
ncbi:MAG: NAD(P)-binding protein [Actinobacteria bacterium]|nr:NAD(P)-binding protein [Actinomycetota bacterium]MCB9411741.1 NAD(P)-binding protein [Actinomycetota bacterium]